MFRYRELVFFIFVTFTNTRLYTQCAMCKAAVESAEDEGGYNDAILYLMTFPYIIGVVALVVFLYNRKRIKE